MRLVQDNGVDREYFLGDALGSVRQLVDEEGVLRLSKDFKPYGEILASSGTTVSNYGFAGEWTDNEIAFLYLRARYYSPTQGRFITKDPSRLEQNLYLYAQGNPVNWIDPTGLHAGIHSGYCYPLQGQNRLACETIVRGRFLPYANRILYSSSWRSKSSNAPWEWGNPTTGSPEALLIALSDSSNMGNGSHQVFWFSEAWDKDMPRLQEQTVKNNWVYKLDFVITPEQISNLCEPASCIE